MCKRATRPTPKPTGKTPVPNPATPKTPAPKPAAPKTPAPKPAAPPPPAKPAPPQQPSTNIEIINVCYAPPWHPPQQQGSAPQQQQGYPPQQQQQHGGNNIEIINAWYGVDGNGSDNGGQVQEHLRRLLREHGHVHIPADQFGLYGFDPVNGVRKLTGLHVRCNGQEHHLRAPEGQVFNWYGN